MAENYSVWELAGVVLVIWTVYLVIYLGFFLYTKDNEQNVPINPQAASGTKPAKSKKNRSKKLKGENKEKKVEKPKNLHKIVPLNKVAFCKHCQVYMEDDEFLKSHENGKKHQKNCKNYDLKWFNIVDKPAEEEKFVSLQPVEIEEGWTL